MLKTESKIEKQRGEMLVILNQISSEVRVAKSKIEQLDIEFEWTTVFQDLYRELLTFNRSYQAWQCEREPHDFSEDDWLNSFGVNATD